MRLRSCRRVNVGDEIVVAGTDVFENAQRVRIAE
jgi:hypothetical protein